MEINCTKLKEKYSDCIKEYSQVKGEVLNKRTEEIETSHLSKYKLKQDINKKCNSREFAECLSKKYDIFNSQDTDLKLIKYLSRIYDDKNSQSINNKMN